MGLLHGRVASEVASREQRKVPVSRSLIGHADVTRVSFHRTRELAVHASDGLRLVAEVGDRALHEAWSVESDIAAVALGRLGFESDL